MYASSVGPRSYRPSGCYTGRVLRPELRALFPASVTGMELSDPELAEPLWPEELAAIERAVDKRKREFTAGRSCARRALAALGIAPVPLLARDDRSVGWPEEAWGSITHTDGLCAAVAARRSHVAGLGIDAEVRRRVSEKLWKQIANAREIDWFRAAPDALAAAERATLLFSAKEAFYKAQYCVSQTFVGFHEAELRFDEQGQFEVTLQCEVGTFFPAGSTFHGRYALLDAHVVTGLVIAAR
jgi:4'-phosphopantetheinyl transferase EntD